MRGRSALYLSTDPMTAVAEYYQELPKPGMLAPYRVEAIAIADLTNGAGYPMDEQVGGAAACEWDKIAKRSDEIPPSWALAHDLIEAGAEGALVPSRQKRGGINLVLWRWHDAREEGEGASLSLLDPEKVLTGRPRR